MNMKRKLLMTVMVLAVAIGAWAGQVGEKQARQKVSAFMTGQAATRGEVSLTRVYLPLQTKSTVWSVTDAPIYIFNYDGGGYVIVSGDDRTADILGFSNTGHIDADRLPVNMKNWLQGYATKIERIPASAVPHRKATTRGGVTKANISTKMKTEWGQSYPYDLHTPELAFSWKSQDTIVHTATGCVATAASMVLNYYRYPAKLKKAIDSYEGTCDVPVLDKGTGEMDTVRNVKWKTENIAAGNFRRQLKIRRSKSNIFRPSDSEIFRAIHQPKRSGRSLQRINPDLNIFVGHLSDIFRKYLLVPKCTSTNFYLHVRDIFALNLLLTFRRSAISKRKRKPTH